MIDIAAILDVYFAGGTAPAGFYVGFVSSANFSGFDPANDTMGSHPGWEEFVDYDETTRPLWTPGLVVSDNPATINNPDPAEITPNAAGTIIGLFLVDEDTPGGTTGQLHGPWFLDEGPQDVIAGTPFRAEVQAILDNQTTVGTPT